MFFASLLLLLPFLSRSQQLMREFALLAAISAAATSLDLLFVAVFSLGQFASLTLSLFFALGVYAGARQWILNQLLGTSMLSAERMFEQLYRIAREVEAHPQNTAAAAVATAARAVRAARGARRRPALHATARVFAHGSTLLVPVPELLPRREARAPRVVVLRYRAPRPAPVHARGRAADRPRASSSCAAPWPSTRRSSRGAARSGRGWRRTCTTTSARAC